MELNDVRSKQNNAGITSRKIYLTANVIRGKRVSEAVLYLNFSTTKAADILKRILNSAVASAKSDKNLKISDLYVKNVNIGPGITRKSRRFAAKGRFKPILKRSTNIEIILSPIVNKETTNE